ncbi:hypothetical protein Ddc_03794 [Ditylenchus destructor]|nr:hypothetical protein Ddc_03794 [Ditylenchus destructor]
MRLYLYTSKILLLTQIWFYGICYSSDLFANKNVLISTGPGTNEFALDNFISTKFFRLKRELQDTNPDTNPSNFPSNDAILTDTKPHDRGLYNSSSPNTKFGNDPENKSDDDPEEGYDGEPAGGEVLLDDNEEDENLREIAENIDNSSVYYDDDGYEDNDDYMDDENISEDMEEEHLNDDDVDGDPHSGDDEGAEFDGEMDNSGVLRQNPQQKLLYRDDGLSTETRYGDDYFRERYGDNSFPNSQDLSTATRYGDDDPYNRRFGRRRRPTPRPWIRPGGRPYSGDWSRMTRYGDDYISGRRPHREDRRWPDGPLPISIKNLDDRKGLPDFLMAASIRAVNDFLRMEHDDSLTKRQMFNEKMAWADRQPRVVRTLYRDFVRDQRMDKRSFDRRRQREVGRLSPEARDVDRRIQLIENNMDVTRRQSLMTINRILEDTDTDVRQELQRFVPVIGPLSDNNVPISPKRPITRYRLLGVESRPSRFDDD